MTTVHCWLRSSHSVRNDRHCTSQKACFFWSCYDKECNFFWLSAWNKRKRTVLAGGCPVPDACHHFVRSGTFWLQPGSWISWRALEKLEEELSPYGTLSPWGFSWWYLMFQNSPICVNSAFLTLIESAGIELRNRTLKIVKWSKCFCIF